MEWALLGLDFGMVLSSSRFLCVVLCEERALVPLLSNFFNFMKLWVSLAFQIPKLLVLPVKKRTPNQVCFTSSSSSSHNFVHWKFFGEKQSKK
jgi:hypothetical protein